MLAAAAMAAGCGSRRGHTDGWQACIDQQGKIVDDAQCQQPQQPTPTGYYHPYHWYYYPYSSRSYPIGYGIPMGGYHSNEPYVGVLSRTGAVPVGARAVAPSAGVVRGGFGATGARASSGS